MKQSLVKALAFVLLAAQISPACANRFDVPQAVARGDGPAIITELSKPGLPLERRQELYEGLRILCDSRTVGYVAQRYHQAGPEERALLRPLLADCRITGAVPEVVAELLNAVQSSAETEPFLALLARLDTEAVNREIDSRLQAAALAVEKGSEEAALIHIGEAYSLAALTGRAAEVEAAAARLLRAAREKNLAALVQSISEELRAGRILSALELLNRAWELLPANLRPAAQKAKSRVERLKAVEDRFHELAGRSDKIRREQALCLDRLKGAEQQKTSAVSQVRGACAEIKERYQALRGDMRVADREIFLSRDQIPAIVRIVEALQARLPR